MLLNIIDPSQKVELEITRGQTGDMILVHYVTPNSNVPNSNGNMLYLWQAETIPWGETPLKYQAVTGVVRQGSLPFTGLSVGNKPYIIGYAVGPEMPPPNWVIYGNVCATAFLPQGYFSDPSIMLTYFSTKINPTISNNNIMVSCDFTPGVSPKTNGAWVALWRGKTNPYLNPSFIKSAPVRDDADHSMVALDDLNLIGGVTYTLALMMSGWNESQQTGVSQTSIAAVTTFTIG